ncbi:MAG: hypothetical protein EKK53_28820 [Burkholderiales bacterium]|nr:MAG: hypothetical protein EKK53_28820 [Burkholderiales bacterium]
MHVNWWTPPNWESRQALMAILAETLVVGALFMAAVDTHKPFPGVGITTALMTGALIVCLRNICADIAVDRATDRGIKVPRRFAVPAVSACMSFGAWTCFFLIIGPVALATAMVSAAALAALSLGAVAWALRQSGTG